MRSRRALLYMPGDSKRKIQRGASSGVDVIVMDLEDGVAQSERQLARVTIQECVQEVDFGRSETLVRVNPMGHPDHEDDIRAILSLRIDGIVLPKVESVEQLSLINERMLLHETISGLPRHSMVVLAILETALGLARLAEIASYAGEEPRFQGLIFGALDYIASLGGQTTESGVESFYARSAVVLHAKAHGLQAVDTVYPAFQDVDGLREDTQKGIELGYTGKQIIHPAQIETVQTAFLPSPEQIKRAQKIVSAYEEQAKVGIGAFALEGQMVDMPVVKEAMTLLERAAASEN